MSRQADDNRGNIGKKSWQDRLRTGDTSLRIHLLGIGGAGLRAIAHVLHEQGFVVSGSDRHLSAATQRLAALGILIDPQQAATNLTKLPAAARPDLVLISSAVGADNPERQAADALGIPVVKRADFLPVLLANRKLIAVAGTAGKTTTTAMIVKVLRDAGIDVGYIIGADLPGYGNAAAGAHACFVLEADEYDHMFLALHPTVAVITNVVWDHPDCYPTAQSFWAAFNQFVDSVPAGGLVVTCADDLGAEQLFEQRSTAQAQPAPCWITYGLAEWADVRAMNVVENECEQHAELIWWHAPKGQITLAAPGLHNLRNALAALAVASYCDVPSRTALASLQNFAGTGRRFEVQGEAHGVTVIDDYAHHPTKVQATLAGARSRYPARRIWAVFQPHTFSRTKHLLDEFAQSFAAADEVLITDIYAAREADDGAIHARAVVERSQHPHMRYVGALDDAVATLAAEVRSGDVVIVMGAGDSHQVGTALLAALGHAGQAAEPVTGDR